ncbi:hypothetical protein ACHAWF_004005, partial [Thalassiosira exigua]
MPRQPNLKLLVVIRQLLQYPQPLSEPLLQLRLHRSRLHPVQPRELGRPILRVLSLHLLDVPFLLLRAGRGVAHVALDLQVFVHVLFHRIEVPPPAVILSLRRVAVDEILDRRISAHFELLAEVLPVRGAVHVRDQDGRRGWRGGSRGGGLRRESSKKSLGANGSEGRRIERSIHSVFSRRMHTCVLVAQLVPSGLHGLAVPSPGREELDEGVFPRHLFVEVGRSELDGSSGVRGGHEGGGCRRGGGGEWELHGSAVIGWSKGSLSGEWTVT